MADKIQNLYPYENGTITKCSESLSGTLEAYACIKIGNIITCSARIHTMSEPASDTGWFMLPEGFRPRTNLRAIGYMAIDGIGTIPVLVVLDPNGRVRAGYSPSKTVTQVGFAATFPI